MGQRIKIERNYYVGLFATMFAAFCYTNSMYRKLKLKLQEDIIL